MDTSVLITLLTPKGVCQAKELFLLEVFCISDTRRWDEDVSAVLRHKPAIHQG
jgi:hypothetical protein